MKYGLIAFLFLIFVSCGENRKPVDALNNSKFIQTFGKGVKTTIGATGFTIELPSTHKMEEKKGPDFSVYYISSIDTTYNKGGAGIYIGPAPDQHPPASMLTKSESAGTTFGKDSRTVTYITPTYTWTETVVYESPDKKIQFWYYATDLVELANLEKMIKTLHRN